MVYGFDEFLIKNGFIINGYDKCVYILKRVEKVILYILLYVDEGDY